MQYQSPSASKQNSPTHTHSSEFITVVSILVFSVILGLILYARTTTHHVFQAAENARATTQDQLSTNLNGTSIEQSTTDPGATLPAADSSTTVRIDTTNDDGTVQATMVVNGEDISVPENGSMHHTTTQNGQTTTVSASNIQSTTGSSGTSYSHNRLNVHSSTASHNTTGGTTLP